MIPIFVCEDDPKQRKIIEQTIKNQIIIEELNMELICSTADPHEILAFNDLKESGLYFLDVDLNCEMDGIELATKIRKIDLNAKIVFVTTHGELATTIFKHKIEALDYIVKDVTTEEFKSKIIDCMCVTRERFNIQNDASNTPYFTFKLNGNMHFIPFHDIMFFETADMRNKVNLHLANRVLQFRGILKEIEERSPLFIRNHHKIVVNKKNINFVNQKKMEIEMVNGEVCPLSVRGLKDLKKLMVDEAHLFI